MVNSLGKQTMVMISKEEVKHIAKLARLELGTSSSQASTEKEIEKMQKDLSSVLGYFDLFKKAPNTKSFTESFSVGASVQHLRKDEASPRKQDLVERLIKAFPDKKDDYIKVKTIL